MREQQIEEARQRDEEWSPPKLEDFLVVPVEEVCQEHRSKTDKNMIEHDIGVEPVEEIDYTEYPEAESTKTMQFDPEEHNALGSTNKRFWFEQGDQKAQEKKEK